MDEITLLKYRLEVLREWPESECRRCAIRGVEHRLDRLRQEAQLRKSAQRYPQVG